MGNISSKLSVYTVLSLSFFAEAMGLPFGRLFAVISSGILVYAHIILVAWRKRQIVIDKLSILVFFFFIFTAFSIIQGADINRSLVKFGEYLVLFGVFYYSIKNYKELSVFLPKVLIWGGFALCIYSLLLNITPELFFIPKHGYQLVFSRFGSHNHLGDFLVLPLLFCLYSVIREKRNSFILPLIFFFPFFLFSYSRSAYMSFFLAALVLLINAYWGAKVKRKLIIPILASFLTVVIVFLFFFATVFESKNNYFLNSVHQTLVDNFGLKFKHFGANRLEFFRTALKSIEKKPFLGVGPGNFVYASRKYSAIPNYRTYSSHNIFLDILTENGLPAFLLFAAILFLILKSAIRNFSVYSLLFFALLFNFQTDYIHTIYLFMMLFIVLAGICLGSSAKKQDA